MTVDELESLLDKLPGIAKIFIAIPAAVGDAVGFQEVQTVALVISEDDPRLILGGEDFIG